ncbi:hypothetical protein [Mycobacterium sp. AZCC_0083]|nr:hypothetical protein [Mycobacterium sp. AZCC_0083]MBB5163893.1 hypothetical protein [Mycobacterium sp. AZCC_0083]
MSIHLHGDLPTNGDSRLARRGRGRRHTEGAAAILRARGLV